MGRVKDWLIEMEEDALCMTRQEWCAKYGEHLSPVFDEARQRLGAEALQNLREIITEHENETSDKSGN